MTDLWFTLLAKSTALLLLTLGAARALRSRPAALRHLVWLSGLTGLIVLPLGMLIPEQFRPPETFLSQAIRPGATIPFARTQIFVVPWVTALWFAGALLSLARLAGAGWSALALVRRCRSSQAAGEDDCVGPDLLTPLAWTFGKGAVLLPPGALGWPEDQKRAVLLHEKAHLMRKDGWALLLGGIACSLYWFHPLAWYAARRLRLEQEHAADDYVLSQGIEPVDYAAHLLTIARETRNLRLLPGAARKSDLTTRVQAILDRNRSRTMLTRRMVLAAAVLLIAIGFPLGIAQTGRKIYKVSDEGITPPRLLYKEDPKYTEQARDARIEGTVKLSAILDHKGKLQDIKIEEGLEPGLDANAIASVETWLFKPAEKDKTPVSVSVNIEINFRLL
jgi:TonB family protein